MGILNEFKANAKALKERVESSEAYKVMKSRITAGRNSFQGDFAFADNGKSILEHEKEPVSAPVSAKNAASNASGHKESSKSQGAPSLFAIFGLLMSIMLFGFFMGCHSESAENDEADEAVSAPAASVSAEQKEAAVESVELSFPVTLNISCESNLLFATYDVDIYVDGAQIGSLEHGTSNAFTAQVTHDVHTLRIVEQGSDPADGEISFDTSVNSEFRFSVHCGFSQVDITEYKQAPAPVSSKEALLKNADELKSLFQEAGFSNVAVEQSKELLAEESSKDGMVKSVAVGDKSEFAANELFYDDMEVVIVSYGKQDVHPPLSSQDCAGMSLDSVRSAFEAAGFTNVVAEAQEVDGYVVQDEVKSVEIGEGFFKGIFSLKDSFSPDEKVVIKYVSATHVLSKESNEDLNALLNSGSTDAAWFCRVYEGQTIMFDGHIAVSTQFESYETRRDVLVLAGDYGASPSLGPNFWLENLSAISEMKGLSEGDNVTVTAKIERYDSTNDWVKLDLITMEKR